MRLFFRVGQEASLRAHCQLLVRADQRALPVDVSHLVSAGGVHRLTCLHPADVWQLVIDLALAMLEELGDRGHLNHLDFDLFDRHRRYY